MRAIRPQEIDSVIVLDGPKRCEYFVKRVADQRVLWGLRGDSGWTVYADLSERRCFPVWSHEEYAMRCAVGALGHCRAGLITVDDWLTKWQEGLINDGTLIAVFPTPQLNAVVLEVRE